MLFSTPDLDPLDHEVIERVLSIRQDLRHSLATRRRWTGVLRRVTMAEAIRGSNTIEGYRVSGEDALAAVDDAAPIEADEDAVAWEATTSYRRAMTYVLQQHDDPHFTYSVEVIRSLHFMLVEYDLDALPGRWRPGPLYVHDTASDAVVHEGAGAGEVPQLMSELVERLEDDEGSALVRGAMAHLNVVMVHPFKDGNGRLARVLQSVVLAREGILAPQFCSIEEYLGRFTRDYYDVLAEVGGGTYQPSRDARPWIRFCLSAHYRQAHALLRRIEVMGRTWEFVDEQLDQAGLPERMAEPVFLALWGHRLTNESYRNRSDTTPSTASRDLRALTEADMLVAHGEKRGRHYTASPLLQERRRESQQALRGARRLDPYGDPEPVADPYLQSTLCDPT